MKAREKTPPALPPAAAFRRSRYARRLGTSQGLLPSLASALPSASMDNTLHDLQNSSHPTRQPHSITVKYAYRFAI